MSTPGRNDPCPCGSGRKFKHCCLGRSPGTTPPGERAAQQALQLAKQHHRSGRLPEAEALYRQVLQHDPDHPDALNLLGLIAQQTGNHAAAADLTARAISVNGAVAGYHSNLGNAYHALNRFDQAVTSYQNAIAIDPNFAEAHYNLGRILGELGKLEEAVACYRKALAINPGLTEAHDNLGIALGKQGRFEEAASCFRKAVAIDPQYANAHSNLGFAYSSQSRPDEAVACFRKALAIKPDMAGALGNLALNLLAQGRPDEALACSRRPMAADAAAAWAHSARLFSMLYLAAYSPDELFAAHRQFAGQFENPLARAWRRHENVADPDRRLKIGYVSPNFQNHSVAFFIEPILACHDKSRVEVYCYSNTANHDDVSDRLAGHADHWIACTGWTDQQLAERVRTDGIDILVDLAGHTQDNRLLVFARRPAPVQITYLGYPATTGLNAVDYRLVTHDTDPPGADAWHSERLLRLPRSLWCYRPRSNCPDIDALAPAIQNGYVTFGSTNNIAKVSPEAIALWARILGALPDSRLVMTGIPEGSVRARVVERFTGLGIAAGRISLHGKLPTQAFMDLCRRIDIALDPFPYNGTTTSCEALWMGIPVISLIGQTSVARSGYAILRTAGLEELAATDGDAYLRIALDLARGLPRLSALRAGMRQRLIASPLRDEAGMARDIEDAFRTAWQGWCRSQARSA